MADSDEDQSHPLPSSGSNYRPLRSRLLDHGASDLQVLSSLRETGWREGKLDNHFKKRQHVADKKYDSTGPYWFKKNKGLFKELDSFANLVPSGGPFEFLDLGCCPGGFSSYILHKNKNAAGVGISLPVEQGGHTCLLEGHLRARLTLHMTDLLYYRLHDKPHDPEVDCKLIPLPDDTPQKFDLIMLDGHQLRVYRGPEQQPTVEWDRHRLFVSQFVIALRAVKPGGTLVVQMSHFEQEGTAIWLLFLDKISKNLIVRKPRTVHANRGTFYAIAEGVGMGKDGHRLDEYQRCLQDLWYEVSFGGEEGKGRALRVADLDFVVTYKELVSEPSVVRLLELGRDPWAVQADGLQGWLRHKKVF